MDLESKGYRIYWPDNRQVSVEQNVQFDSGDSAKMGTGHEGKKQPSDVPSLTTNKTTTPPISKTQPPSLPSLPDSLHSFKPDNSSNSCPQHAQKPSVQIQQILNGKGSATGLQYDPKIPWGIQFLTNPEVNEGSSAVAVEGEDEWVKT